METPNPQNRIPAQRVPRTPLGEQQSLTENYYQTARQTIQDNPLVTTMTVFGVGFAVGSVLGGLLAETARSHSRRHSLTERAQDRISAALSDVIPGFIEQKFHG